jgi:hypothetical protein
MALRGRFQKGIFVAWQGNGMACVNQTRPHYVNQMGKTQSKALTERHGRGTAGERHGNGMGTAWERHGMCESSFKELGPSPSLGKSNIIKPTLCAPLIWPVSEISYSLMWSILQKLIDKSWRFPVIALCAGHYGKIRLIATVSLS